MNFLKIPTNLPYVSSFQVLNLFTLPDINFAIIDFRSREYFNHKSIRGSLNYPLSKIKPEGDIQKQLFPIFKGYSRYLYKSRKLLSVVLFSNRGEEALLEPIQSTLQQSNYKNVTILSGGFESFESKYPWLCEGNMKQIINLDLFAPMNSRHHIQNKKKRKTYRKREQILICKHPSEIIPDFLWLGSVRTANNEKILRLLGIKRIINLSIEVEKENKFDLDLYSKLGIKHHSITFDDKINVDITQKIERVVNIINENDSKILIHCSMGISRSSAAIIYYLMKYQALSYQQAYGWVKSCRSLIDPNPGFVRQLKYLEKQCVN